MTMLTTNLLAAAHRGFFMPIQASEIAREIDPLAWYIHGVTIFFTVGICAATAYFAWKYRASAYPVADPPGHNNALEVTWTVIPAIIIFIMFFWGFRVFTRMTTPKPSAIQIDAIGQMWEWSFQYRNPKGGPDIKTKDLYLPKGMPVEFTLRSNDVLHALYIPTMRIKKDVVPGRFNKMYVTATKTTTPEKPFHLYCAEYCGDLHSRMLGKVHVLETDAFYAELEKLANPMVDPTTMLPLPLEEAGKKVASLNGCFSCHSVDGKKGVGPTWKDLYGAPSHKMADGSTVAVDDNYIVESIRNPNAKVVEGFGPPSAMNAFPANQLPDEHVKALIAYMRAISANAPKSAGQPSMPSSQPAGMPQGALTPTTAATGGGH